MDEYISRKLLMDQLREVYHWCGYEDRYDEYVSREDIENLPSANVAEVVHGYWKLWRDGSGTCSNCRRTTRNVWDYDSSFRFCPDCGAKMDMQPVAAKYPE